MPAFAAASTGSDPFQSVSNFFNSGLWSVIAFALQAFVVVMWLALVWWTYQDVRRRTDNPMYHAGAVALAFFIPFFGPLVYLVLRPAESMLEARERELELIALERRLGEVGDHEGQRIVGRILGRDASGGADQATLGALRQAGVATRDELRDLDIRLTELEFRLRNVGRAQGAEGAQAERPQGSDTGRTMIRRIRRGVSDPEASIE
ncbi:MAG: hypothetical protein U0Y82_09050 [Thermoleophilia bacterium]